MRLSRSLMLLSIMGTFCNTGNTGQAESGVYIWHLSRSFLSKDLPFTNYGSRTDTAFTAVRITSLVIQEDRRLRHQFHR